MARNKPLCEQIINAANELKLARRDGSCERITKAAKQLDDLDQYAATTK